MAIDQPTSAPDIRWLDLAEEALLSDCRFDAFRGSGPGGQKRNKTSSAIRLTHLPTGISVMAEDSRSQAENKLRSIRRLKLKLATELRCFISPFRFAPPEWFKLVTQLGKLAASHHNEHYARTAGLILDLLSAKKGNIGSVAKLLMVTTSSVVKFLEEEPQLWTAANNIRKEWKLGPLDKRR